MRCYALFDVDCEVLCEVLSGARYVDLALGLSLSRLNSVCIYNYIYGIVLCISETQALNS